MPTISDTFLGFRCPHCLFPLPASSLTVCTVCTATRRSKRLAEALADAKLMLREPELVSASSVVLLVETCLGEVLLAAGDLRAVFAEFPAKGESVWKSIRPEFREKQDEMLWKSARELIAQMPEFVENTSHMLTVLPFNYRGRMGFTSLFFATATKPTENSKESLVAA